MGIVKIDDIESHKFDFNVEHYAEILKLAKKKYKFTNYSDRRYEEGQKAYWRHDVDISLNRALRLAQVEMEHEVSSTFFLNLHCEFYNIFEKSQFEIIKKILSLGHQIGLHLDASFYPITNEQELISKIQTETAILESLLDIKIYAFSFHNPDSLMLSFEKEEYGGLVNCYAKIFKTSIGYCSDSNGYWRFNRLQDFLESNNYQSVQILTHPEWWQESSMTPRERIFRCVDGRAKQVMNQYDTALAIHNRENLGVLTEEFNYLKSIFNDQSVIWDAQWMRGSYESVFLDISRCFEGIILNSVLTWFDQILNVPSSKLAPVLATESTSLGVYELFAIIYSCDSAIIIRGSDSYDDWTNMRRNLVYGYRKYTREELEFGLKSLINNVNKILHIIQKHETLDVKYFEESSEDVYTEFKSWLSQNSIRTSSQKAQR